MTEPTAGVAETLRALRAQLNAVLDDRPEEGIMFDLGETEVELQVSVTKEAGGDAGVRLGVISVGAKGGVTGESVHRVLVRLQPMQVEVDAQDPEKKTVTRALISERVRREPR
jgi:hypothetical protein